MYKICVYIILLGSIKATAQDSLATTKIDTATKINVGILPTLYKKGNQFFPYNHKKQNQVAYSQIIGYTANFTSLYAFWYKDYPKSQFHFFNDIGEYLQVDKVSHVYGAYTGGRMSMQMWKWAGASKNKYVWLGGMSGLAYESLIEVMDGFSDHWGFSVGDYVANILGTSLLIGQELAWNEQRITIKYGTHLAKYDDPVVDAYLNHIYGKSKTDRLFKDYNTQTYWLSFNLKSFFNWSA